MTDDETETAIRAALDALPPAARARLRVARAAIAEEAAAIAPERRLEASLKWGQPSFALSPKMGAAIRLGLSGGRPAMLVHCGTALVEDWRLRMGPEADVAGTRAVFVDRVGIDALRPFIRAALTYRRRA